MIVDLDTMGISQASFSGRVLTAFKRDQIFSLGQLDRMTDSELTALHGIGTVSLLLLRDEIDRIRGTQRGGQALHVVTGQSLMRPRGIDPLMPKLKAERSSPKPFDFPLEPSEQRSDPPA